MREPQKLGISSLSARVRRGWTALAAKFSITPFFGWIGKPKNRIYGLRR